MAVHDRDCAAQLGGVRGFHDFEPLAGLDLVGADHRADLVVEDLGRSAGQRAQSGRLQLAQEIGERAAESLGALPDLERREGVDVDVGHRFLDRAADRKIGGAGIFRVNPALHTDFGRAAVPRFLDPPLDLREIEVIRPAAQIFAELALRECAELAAEIADVGVVDVAGHDIAHHVAIDPLPQLVGRPAHRIELVTARPEEPDYIRFVERLSGRGSFQRRCQLPLTHPALRAWSPLSRTAGEGDERSEAREGRWFDTGSGYPIVRPREPLRINRAQHRRAQRGIDPAVQVARVGRVDRQPLDQDFAGCGGLLGQPVQSRPRPLGVDVIGSDR